MIRFAPSPTGPFHIGNIRTAWAAQLWSEKHSIPIHVRIEDLDPLRSRSDFQEDQIRSLRELGLRWKEQTQQSQHRQRYLAFFESSLNQQGLYPCICSRRQVQESLGHAPHGESPVYSGHCRTQNHSSLKNEVVNYRFRNPADTTGRLDVIVARGKWGETPSEFSYHWACALDDWHLEPSHIVRAWDLESVVVIHKALFDFWNQMSGENKRYPELLHTSLVLMLNGNRMEKRSQGVLWRDVLMTAGLDSIRESLSKSLDSEAIRNLVSERHRHLRYDPGTMTFFDGV